MWFSDEPFEMALSMVQNPVTWFSKVKPCEIMKMRDLMMQFS
jgi:hypothetical protein